ncbi:hypothetical protein Tco_0632950 [Tanacetum coccineum]
MSRNMLQVCLLEQHPQSPAAHHHLWTSWQKDHPNKVLLQQRLEYLRHGNEEKKYAFSVTKIKAARYEQEGIKEWIPHLWSPSIYKYNKNVELGIHHWRDDHQWFYKGSTGHKSAHDVYINLKIISVNMITVEKKYVYGYLKEIVVKRADKKEYTFADTDFPRLNQNDY